MNVYRAMSVCPYCAVLNETWNYKGVFVPSNMQECTNCSSLFNPAYSITNFLALKTI